MSSASKAVDVAPSFTGTYRLQEALLPLESSGTTNCTSPIYPHNSWSVSLVGGSVLVYVRHVRGCPQWSAADLSFGFLTFGMSSTTAIPQIPWPMAAQAASGEPIAIVATPVPNVISRTTSSAWFVWRPGGCSSVRSGRRDSRGSPLERRITSVIRYVTGP